MHLKQNTIYDGRGTLVPRHAAGLGTIPFSRVIAACGGNSWGKAQISAGIDKTKQPLKE
jgi:hypothetical protein